MKEREMSTYSNHNGESYYCRENADGELEYSFTTDFEDIWSEDDQVLEENRGLINVQKNY